MHDSKFIVIEGLEGAGKTTVIQYIKNYLYKIGVKKILCTREPGSTPLAEILRNIIQQGFEDEYITPYAELLMLYTARVQLIEGIIKPALAQGTWVIGDRHDLSSQAYQGGGRGIESQFINILRHFILGDFRPDLTFYLDVNPKMGLKRIKNKKHIEYQLDRIEMESLLFFKRTRERYKQLANSDINIIIINANKPLEQVISTINYKLNQWLKTQKILI